MAAMLLIPFFLLRFGLMALLSRPALARAAAFAPVTGAEIPAYWVYQLSNAALIIALFFLQFTGGPLLLGGTALYGAGSVLLAASVAGFCTPDENGINRRGAYRYSRNPMYMSYFLVFLGCAAMTASLLLLARLLCFQISAHWIIMAEERSCIQRFGQDYLDYMKQVRRYF